jgi:O-antigen ligase
VTPAGLAGVERWFLRSGAFLLPLAYWWDSYDRYVLPKLLVARVVVIGLLILFLARAIVRRSLTIKRTPLDLPLLAFVASAVVSTVFAYNANVAIFGTYSRYDGLLTILMYAALFWLSVQAIATPNEARTLIRALLASGYLVAVVAILQSVTDSISQGLLVPASGTLGQKNVLGAFLAMLLPLAYRELAAAKSWSQRVIGVNLTAIIGVALLLTLSRSAWLGAALAAIVLFAGGYRPTVRLGIACLLVLLIGGGIVAGLRSNGGIPAEQRVAELGLTGDRPALWRDAVRLTASRPVFGYGPDNFGLVFPRFQTTYLGPWQWDKAHAETLQVAATQGLVGLVAYAFVLAAFVRAFWRAIKFAPPLAGEGRVGAFAIFAAWLAYEVTLQLNFSALAASLPFWIFAAAAMESWGAPRRLSLPLSRLRGRAGWGLAAITITALATLMVVATVFPYLADSRLLAAVNADVQGHLDQAAAAAAQARKFAPQESVYAVEVGNIAFERGDWSRAADAYGAAARLGTYNPLIYRNLALADRNLARWAEARAAAQKAVEMDRYDPANQALMAQLRLSP